MDGTASTRYVPASADSTEATTTVVLLSMRTIVVMPTYQEAGSIIRSLTSVLGSEVAPDVLVVDDSSPDGTGELVRAMAAGLPPGRLGVLTRRQKTGLGSAYRAGFALALERGYEAVVQMDADGSHPASAIAELTGRLAQGADLALGSRYTRGGELAADWPLARRALSRGGNSYARLLLGCPVRDLTGGFKAWRADCLRALDLDGLDASGYAFQIQATVAALRRGATVVEVPICFAERQQGASKMHSGIVLEAMSAVLRLRRDSGRTGSAPHVPAQGSPVPRPKSHAVRSDVSASRAHVRADAG